jgi:peptide/nickel transport system permease protein
MFLFVVIISIIGPGLAPHDPLVVVRDSAGQVAVLRSPSWEFPMGTTVLARDIYSQVLIGTRTAVLVGSAAALVSGLVGTLLGVASGYYGGWFDNVMQRLVEVAYAIPFEPLAIILISILSPSVWTIILAISLVFWRQAMRVIRTQVMTVKERSFVKAARVAGANDLRIMLRHITPNILPLAFVYLPVAFGNAIMAEAAVSFLGFGDARAISWGQILRQAFTHGASLSSWWWFVTPGLLITLTTSSVFFCTRPFEEILNPKLRG